MYSCPGCGGEMRFEPSVQKLVCDHCDRQMTVPEYNIQNPFATTSAEGEKATPGEAAFEGEEILRAQEKQQQGEAEEFETYIFTCPQCGGEIMAEENTAATFCCYCGSSIILKPRISREKAPDFIIPFSKTMEDCATAYKRTLARAIFAPNSFRQDATIERFRGIYMPYWIYAYQKKGHVSAKGTSEYRRGDYIYTDHYDVGFDVDANCAGIAYDAASNFSDNLSQAIAPFDMEGAQYFDKGYLAGFYADVRDVRSGIYVEEGRNMMAQETAQRALSRLKTKSTVESAGLVTELRPVNTRTDFGFFPVWFLANRSKDGSRVSYAVVNGQTGRVAADLPVSWGKFAIGSLIVAVPIFFFLNLLVTLTPLKVVIATIIMAIVSWIIINRQANLLYTREHSLDDAGYAENNEAVRSEKSRLQASRHESIAVTAEKPKTIGGIIVKAIIWDMIGFFALVGLVNWGSLSDVIEALLLFYMTFGQMFVIGYTVLRCTTRNHVRKSTKRVWYTAPASEKIKYIWKNLVAIALCVIMLFWDPIYDEVYYGVALAAVLLVGWSFIDMIRQHNLLTQRPLPQFNPRGGEEYEHRQ